MKHEFRLADIGEGLEEAEIISWLVEVGDLVERDQPLIEVMTDKSNAELPAPAAGRVVELGGAIGDILTVGELIAMIDDAPIHGAAVTDHEDSRAGVAASQDSQVSTITPDQGNEPPQEPALASVLDEPVATSSPPLPRPKASPSTRRVARERGIDLHTIIGTGPGGRILASDLDNAPPPSPEPTEPPAVPEAVLDFVADLVPDAPETQQASTPTSTATPATPRPAVPTSLSPAPTTTAAATPAAREDVVLAPIAASATRQAPSTDETTPLRGIRRLVAQNMARSWFDIPHIHAYDHIDAQPLLDLRERMRATGHQAYNALTPLSFFVAAVAKALRTYPLANASINMVEETITHHASVNIGVAVAAPQGLVVPVLHGADQLSFDDLAVKLAALIQAGRAGSLAREQLQGGTATITNFGSLGGEQAAPLIRPGESIIVGFGSIKERPFVVDGEVRAQNTMHMVAAADHRLLDGDITTAFLRNIAETFVDPLDLVL